MGRVPHGISVNLPKVQYRRQVVEWKARRNVAISENQSEAFDADNDSRRGFTATKSCPPEDWR